jgi:hypothetical protein
MAIVGTEVNDCYNQKLINVEQVFTGSTTFLYAYRTSVFCIL